MLKRNSAPGSRIAAALALAALAASGAHAATPSGQSYKVLYFFAGTNNGLLPSAPLAADKSGNLYGTANQGGPDGYGLVFKVARNGTEKTLYAFTGGSDGGIPSGTLAIDESGNLYGTTFQGGAAGDGTVFELKRDGTETVLHSFNGGNDGDGPTSGVLRDKSGRLWGTTAFGGANSSGTVFTISPAGKARILHAFAGSDGATPEAGVLRDGAGDLYGTTLQGGAGNVGTVYKLAPDGTETVLYSFQNGLDGGEPSCGLVADKSGNLYGTTLIGGAQYDGVVFEVAPSGSETVLYTFTGGPDGGEPYGTLVRSADGNLFGTTANGGTQGAGFGVVFKLAPNGRETVLHAFQSGTDGDTPRAGLVAAPAIAPGYLFGTATGAADFGHGTVFKVSR